MNRLGIAALAFAAGMVFGHFAPTGFGGDMTHFQRCLDEASKRLTDAGVRAAAEVCKQRFIQ